MRDRSPSQIKTMGSGIHPETDTTDVYLILTVRHRRLRSSVSFVLKTGRYMERVHYGREPWVGGTTFLRVR